MHQTLLIATTALCALALPACGGDVTAAPSSAQPGPATEAASPSPSASTVPQAAACATPVRGVVFDGPIADLAVDARYVWALLGDDQGWHVARADKCDGSVSRVGGEVATVDNMYSVRPIGFGVAGDRVIVAALAPDRSTVRLTYSSGGSTSPIITTLYGPAEPPAFSGDGTAAVWSVGESLHASRPANGDDKVIARLPTKDGPTVVESLAADGARTFGYARGRVFAHDRDSDGVSQSAVLLAASATRHFVVAGQGEVFAVGGDVVRLRSSDLSEMRVHPLAENGAIVDVALHERFLFFTQLRDGRQAEVYRMKRDGSALEALPVEPGPGGQLAVDATALYVGRGSRVTRTEIQ